jgi:energy-coupling factor transporter ATP-binding protein EcfA2
VIERLDIENLKSFQGRHEIGFAPLTLIFGPNSSGKSTLIQSLAMLKQTLEPQTARFGLFEEPPLALHGELIDLGSYPAAINDHEIAKKLYVGLCFRDPSPNAPRAQVIGGISLYAGLGFSYSKARRAATLRRSVIGDGDNPWSFDALTGEKSTSSPYGGPSFQLLAGSRSGLLRTVGARSEHAEPPLDGLHRRWRDHLEQRFAVNDLPIFWGQGFFPIAPAPISSNGSEGEAQQLPYALLGDDLFGVRARAFADLLSSLAYLGPLRAAPKRFQLLSNEQPINVGPTGEHTPIFLARSRRLLTGLNEWLKTLDIPYRLDVHRVSAEELGVELGDLLAMTLQDVRTNLVVTPQDVGFGISQLLPVIVETLVGQRRTICVEQPEIHIHPALQAHVGDLLIDAIGPGRENQVIVETHSEYLMLRIQRRLRERRPEWLAADQIAVLYVDNSIDGNSRARRINLDENGDFVDEWPRGFFAERIQELFGSD